jgi:hypothetical protein
MKKFYHIDRLGILQENKNISLIQYNDIKPQELQCHADEMFPQGFSHHGDHYFLKNQSQAKIASPNIEILFEYVRRAHYKNRPSRFQSVFAFETIEQALDFKQKFGTSNSLIWEVESQENFKADMNLLTIGNNSILVYSYFAHLYWQGKTRENTFWEYLLVPPVKIIKKIEESN